MKIIHKKGFTEHELNTFKHLIQSWCLESIKYLIEYSMKKGVEFPTKAAVCFVVSIVYKVVMV
jgi:hypothetical protein